MTKQSELETPFITSKRLLRRHRNDSNLMFSSRTNWHRQPNRLSELLEERCKNGNPIFDLTITNPTECGIVYPEKEILAALANPQALHYQPDSHGLLTTREAISEYYREKKVVVNPSDIFLPPGDKVV